MKCSNSPWPSWGSGVFFLCHYPFPWNRYDIINLFENAEPKAKRSPSQSTNPGKSHPEMFAEGSCAGQDGLWQKWIGGDTEGRAGLLLHRHQIIINTLKHILKYFVKFPANIWYTDLDTKNFTYFNLLLYKLELQDVQTLPYIWFLITITS